MKTTKQIRPKTVVKCPPDCVNVTKATFKRMLDELARLASLEEALKSLCIRADAIEAHLSETGAPVASTGLPDDSRAVSGTECVVSLKPEGR